VVGEPGDLLERVDHDVPHTRGHRLLDLRGQLVIAVQGDQRRVHPRRQRDRELAAGADVHAKALFRDPAEHGAGAERLGRVVHLRVLAERVHVLARPAPHVRLVHDERRRAEPRRQVTDVDPAERQDTADAVRAARPDRRVKRVQVLWRRRRVIGGQHVPMTWPSWVGNTAHSYLPGERTPVPPDVLSGGADGKNRHCIGPAREDGRQS